MTTLNVVRRQNGRVRPGLQLQFDYWLLMIVAGLLVVGALMVYSTTFDLGILYQDGNRGYYIVRQVGALILGATFTALFLRFDYHVLRRYSVPLMGGALLLLVLVLFIGEEYLGATRGLFGASVQPSELAKLAGILYIADWLASKGERVKDLTYGLAPFSIIVGVVCGLIVLQPDLGTATLIAMVSVTMFYIAGAALKGLGIFAVMGGLAFALAVTVLPHAPARIDLYKESLREPLYGGWHIQQSVLAFNSGGLLGVGLGESTQKFGPLPLAHTDGVFAILGEELGLVGNLVVMALVIGLAARGVRIALKARDNFGFLLAVGLTFWLTLQSLTNMAVITAVVPFTGIPLPFLSYGGSSMLFSMIAFGLLLNISRDANLDTRVQTPRQKRETLRETLDMRRRHGRPRLSRAGGRR